VEIFSNLKTGLLISEDALCPVKIFEYLKKIFSNSKTGLLIS